MAHPLTLELPEEVYGPLADSAGRAKTTPEELAVAWLAAVARHAAADPLEGFIGAFSGTVPDWADEHNRYLGQALHEKLRGRTDAGS
jgi:hypothetical protein